MPHPDRLPPLVERAIQNGLFSPTSAWRKSNLSTKKIGAKFSAEHMNTVQSETAHAITCNAGTGAERKHPICNPIDTYSQLKAEGYRCICILASAAFPSESSSQSSNQSNRQSGNHTHSQSNYPWDQQLISSLWYCLHPVELALTSASLNDTPASLSETLLKKWFQSTAKLSPQRRLERFTNELLLTELQSGPLAICLNSLAYFQAISGGIELLFTWINHCYQQLTTQKGCYPLRFVVLGQIVF